MLLADPENKYDKNSRLFKLIRLSKLDFQLVKWPIDIFYKKESYGRKNIDLFFSLLKLYADSHQFDATYWAFKLQFIPGLINKLDNISNHYDTIKYINLVRDPRAIFNSSKKILKKYPNLVLSVNPVIVTTKWKMFVKESPANNERNIFTIKYEDLILGYEKCIEQLFQFLHLKKNECSKSKLYKHLAQTDKEIHYKIDENPDQTRIYAWKSELSSIYINLIEFLLKDERSIFGYSNMNIKGEPIIIQLLNYYYKVRILLKLDRY
jgi:hypothetical protein